MERATGTDRSLWLDPRWRGVTVTSATSRSDQPEAQAIQQFTFQRDASTWSELRHLRGIHQMIANRLDLWRLEHFDLTRLPSGPRTYLFHCRAREHPSDVRLLAIGEVRDLTPTVDDEGVITGLPELERVLAACLDDLRHSLAEHPRASGRTGTGSCSTWGRSWIST